MKGLRDDIHEEYCDAIHVPINFFSDNPGDTAHIPDDLKLRVNILICETIICETIICWHSQQLKISIGVICSNDLSTFSK